VLKSNLLNEIWLLIVRRTVLAQTAILIISLVTISSIMSIRPAQGFCVTSTSKIASQSKTGSTASPFAICPPPPPPPPPPPQSTQSVTVSIVSSAVNDIYVRYHGLAVDAPLTQSFWIDNPSSVIGVQGGSFSYSTTLSLSLGQHYFTYAVSSFQGYWHAKISINGVLMSESDTDAYHHLVGSSSTPETIISMADFNRNAYNPCYLTINQGGAGTPQPYIGGFYSTGAASYGAAPQVRVTVSFPSTSASAIPSDSYLAAGMLLNDQGGVESTDYGFLASLSLNPDGSVQYNMAAYQTYEGGVLRIGEYSKFLFFRAIPMSLNSISDPVTITMSWDTNGYVFWYYQRPSDSSPLEASNYKAIHDAPTIKQFFFVGQRNSGLANFIEDRYFDFGIYSSRSWSSGNWNARLAGPQYVPYQGNAWVDVGKAESNSGGRDAGIDDTWGWGCNSWTGVNALYPQSGSLSGNAVQFYYSGTTLPTGTPLWNNAGNEIYRTNGALSGGGASSTSSVTLPYGAYDIAMAGNANSNFYLYVRWGQPPTTSVYDATSQRGGALQWIKQVSGSGTLYVMVYSNSGGGNWILRVLSAAQNMQVEVASEASGNFWWSPSDQLMYNIYLDHAWAHAWVFLSGPDNANFKVSTNWSGSPACTTVTPPSQGVCDVSGSDGPDLIVDVIAVSGSGPWDMVALLY